MMLSVTNKAKTLLNDLAHDLVTDQSEDETLRLTVTGQRNGVYNLRPDRERPGDEIYLHDDGRVFLLVEGDLAQKLDGKVLDAEPTTDGSRQLMLKDRRTTGFGNLDT